MKLVDTVTDASPSTLNGHTKTHKNGFSTFPSFNELPRPYGDFPCSWEYFNSINKEARETGGRDQMGTLNFLTPERVADAKSEIRTGKTISLNHSMTELARDMSAFGGRAPPSHSIKIVMPNAREDSLNANTQASSHFDGFRHFGFFGHNVFYQGYTEEDLANSSVLGVHSWCERGIVGRGVLVDFYAWATARGEDPGLNTGRAITLADVISILEFQQTTMKPGDILIFRTGWMEWYRETAPDIRHDQMCIKHSPGSHAFVGLEASKGFVEWLWNNQVSAVGGDQPAFEATPPPAPETTGWLHEYLLAGLGCPMGELWDVEHLAKECQREGRHSFFFTSMPLNLEGGVATPLNGVAVF